MSENLHKIIIAIVILMYSNSFVQNGLLPISIPLINLVAMIITAMLLFSNWKACIRLIWEAKDVLLLMLLAVGSSLWSIAPEITFRRSLILAGSISLGVYIASRYSFRDQVIFYSRILIFVCFATILVALFFPENGIHQDTFHAGRLRGITLHKNILGEWLALAMLMFIFLPASLLKMSRMSKYLVATMTIILLSFTVSLTSVLAVLMVMCISPALATLRWDYRLRGAMILYFVAVLIVVFVVVALFYVDILELIGRTPTLSGRSTIWPVVLEIIGDRPIFGYGYHGFFATENPLVQIMFRNIWNPEHAHNVWLDLGIEFGLAGITLFIYIILRSLKQAYTLYVEHHKVEIMLIVLLIFNILARSMTETLAIGRRDLIWIMLISLTVSLRFEYSCIQRYNKSVA